MNDSKIILIFIIILLSSIQQNLKAQSASVIYGEDGRLDLYEVTDEKLRQAMRSTAAMVPRSTLVARNGFINGHGTTMSLLYDLKTRHYGKSNFLCTSERFFDQPIAATCSAALIAPNLILTAGHCIGTEGTCRTASFIFGFSMNSENEPQTTFKAEDIVHCKKIVAKSVNNQGIDFSVVEIDREITHLKPLILSNNSRLQVGTPLVAIGQPSGLPTKASIGGSVRKILSNEGYLIANIDAYKTSSGSAVINPATLEIEGVLVRGDKDFVKQGSCYVSNVCENNSCRGEDVTLASAVMAQLKMMEPRLIHNDNQRGGFQGRRL